MGCRGGLVFNSYLYMINSGVSTYNCYPYRGRVRESNMNYHVIISSQQSYCSYRANCTCAKMSGMVRIEFGNETDLQAALATVGPVAVTIDGSSKAFRVSLLFSNHTILLFLCFPGGLGLLPLVLHTGCV